MLHILPVMLTGGFVEGAEPAILTVDNTFGEEIACGVEWKRTVEWTMTFFNDVGYEIQIRDDANGGMLVASGLPTSGAFELVTVTGAFGDPTFTGNFHNAQYTVELVRKATSTVVDTMQTALVTIETGAPC